jgi:lambda family phage minor tail protein L
MSFPESIASEINKLSPSAVVELFILDPTEIGGTEIYYFHAGTNELRQNIVWQGQEYVRYPIEVTGFEVSGQGQIPRPKLRISNYLSVVSALLLLYKDLIGTKITRKRTLVRYLDAVNFTGGVNATEDNTASFPDDIFYIDRKSIETRDLVEFELAATIDLAGVRLPRRQIIQNLCPWRYRGSECGYTGTDYFTSSDEATIEVSQDVCGKRLTSCKLRFGETSQLPFGGFPGAGLFR